MDSLDEICDREGLIEDLHFSDTEWDLNCFVPDSPSPCLSSCGINCHCSSPLDCTINCHCSSPLDFTVNCHSSSPLDCTPTALSYLPPPDEILGTHVMHPKLVNTLKSFVTPPSPTFSNQCGSSSISVASSKERIHGGISGSSSEQRSNCGISGISGALSEERRNGGSSGISGISGISGASSEERRNGGNSGISGISGASSEERSNGGKQVYSSMQQQQQSQSSALTAVRTVAESPEDVWLNLRAEGAEAMVDEEEAAVVSVDWIQNRRPFNCEFAGCDKTFKNAQTMKMHHKTHYSEDSAYRPMDAHAHRLLLRAGHNNKKIPSRCPVCRKTFVGLYELRRHFGRKHTVGDKTFGCTKCSKKFYIEVDLRDHEKLCGDPIECKCGMKFAFKCNLVAHKKGHPDCQDPPSEEEQIKNRAHNSSRQQTGSSRFRNTSSALAPATTGKRNSPSSEEFPVTGLSSNDIPNSSSECYCSTNTTDGEFPAPGSSSDDVMNFWSKCYYSTTTTNGSFPLLSRSAPGILVGSTTVPDSPSLEFTTHGSDLILPEPFKGNRSCPSPLRKPILPEPFEETARTGVSGNWRSKKTIR